MIRLLEVSKRFGNKDALRRISLTLNRGEVLGLLGRDGAGKSTTLRILSGIIRPTAGEIVRPPDFQIKVGYLPDEPFAFDYLTGREMLSFKASLHQIPREATQPKIRNYLQLFGMETQADSLIKTYSRCMRRKTALIGSLMSDPAYWILDEPTESLDPKTIQVLEDLITSGRAGRRAILMSTRNLPFAESVCDRLILLNRGNMAFHGTPDELRARRRVTSALEDICFQLVSA